MGRILQALFERPNLLQADLSVANPGVGDAKPAGVSIRPLRRPLAFFEPVLGNQFWGQYLILEYPCAHGQTLGG